MSGREVALALAALAAATGAAEAGRVQPGSGAWKKCKKTISLHQPEGLPAVDWCNFKYLGSHLKLSGGRSELHEYAEMGGPHDTRIAQLDAVAYLDVDGDGRREALIVIHQIDWIVGDDGASKNHERTMIFAYGWKGGGPVLLGTMEAGVPVFAVAAHRGKVAVRSGPKPLEDEALSRFRLTPDGLEPQ